MAAIDSIDSGLDALRDEFSQRFEVAEARPYGRKGHRYQGWSDNAPGVQWNAGIDRLRGAWTLGVNLEGMKYDGWPIARFIEAELAEPLLLSVAENLSRPSEIELWLEREAWQAAARLPILEYRIGPEPPVLLDSLTEELWLEMLREAFQCLDPGRGHRGRARQLVTLKSGQAEKGVAPHLQFKLVICRGERLALAGIGELLEDGVRTMTPLHEFVRIRAAPAQ